MPNGTTYPQMPQMPKFEFADPTRMGLGVDFSSIQRLLTQKPTALTGVLPTIRDILGAESAYIQPQIAGIRETGEIGAATAQSELMRRGMTGSDIEAAAMQAPRAEAQRAEAQLRGQVGMQQAQTLAANVMQAYGFDIAQNQAMYQQLAQAIGQELSFKRQREMFYDQLKVALKIAEETGDSSVLSGLISAAGSIGGGVALGLALSDSRLKQNVEPLNIDGTLAHLHPVAFEWKATGKKAWGLIADEMETFYPHMVTTMPDELKAIDYTQVVALLIEVVKGLELRLKQLEKEKATV